MNPTATPVRYDYLDALRGWAILAVLMVHAATHTGVGYLAGGNFAVAGKYGVQLFFMVSAYTIFLTLDRARWVGWWTCREFFVRRFFRVLPMFWLGLALYAFVPGRAPADVQSPFTALDYALTASLQHGWSPRICNALVPGGWSIAAEGVFYLVAPLCFRLVRTWQAAVWLLLGSLALSEAALDSVVALCHGGHLFAGVPAPVMSGYYRCWLPTQFPAFACGILAYHLTRHLEGQRPDRSTGALLLAVAALWTYTVTDIGKHRWVVEPTFFALGFLPLIVGLKAWPAAALVNPVTQFLGKVSYSAYLLHFAVLEAALNSLDTFLEPEWQEGLPAFALLFVVTLLGTAPLAWLAHRCVERPCIELGAGLIRRWRRAADAVPTAAGVPGVAVAAGP